MGGVRSCLAEGMGLTSNLLWEEWRKRRQKHGFLLAIRSRCSTGCRTLRAPGRDFVGDRVTMIQYRRNR